MNKAYDVTLNKIVKIQDTIIRSHEFICPNYDKGCKAQMFYANPTGSSNKPYFYSKCIKDHLAICKPLLSNNSASDRYVLDDNFDIDEFLSQILTSKSSKPKTNNQKGNSSSNSTNLQDKRPITTVNGLVNYCITHPYADEIQSFFIPYKNIEDNIEGNKLVCLKIRYFDRNNQIIQCYILTTHINIRVTNLKLFKQIEDYVMKNYAPNHLNANGKPSPKGFQIYVLLNLIHTENSYTGELCKKSQIKYAKLPTNK